MRGRAGVLAVLAVALAGCGSSRYEASSDNMAPTIGNGDEFEVDRDAYRDARPRIGEIVIFRAPSSAEDRGCGAESTVERICAKPDDGFSDETYIDRVVALPGDRVSLRGGKVVRNGTLETAPYAGACPEARVCDLPRTITIPAEHYLVLGDNRAEANDSRFWGPVPEMAITGRVEP